MSCHMSWLIKIPGWRRGRIRLISRFSIRLRIWSTLWGIHLEEALLTSQRRQHRSVHVGIFHDQETLRFWSSPSSWRYLYSVRSQHSRLIKMAILADHGSRKPDLCEWFSGSETGKVSKRCDHRNRVFLLSYWWGNRLYCGEFGVHCSRCTGLAQDGRTRQRCFQSRSFGHRAYSQHPPKSRRGKRWSIRRISSRQRSIIDPEDHRNRI